MKITFKRSWLVKPAEPTFQGCLPLSVWDQIGCVTHIPAVYFYRPADGQHHHHQQQQQQEEDWLISPDSIISCLETSLSKVLVHFYPLAGRLRCLEGGRLEVDCNAAGVELVEAESNGTLSDFGDFSASHKFNHLFPSVDYDDIPFEEHPLLYVQLTKFRCGGISLSFTMSHAVADGQSAVHFISEWARIARGEPLRNTPVFDRKVFETSTRPHYPPSKTKSPTTPLFQHDQYFQLLPVLIGKSESESLSERKKPTSTAVLKLTKTQVETLKKKANMQGGGVISGIRFPYTRYEVIAAHTWRSACKARNLVEEQPTSLGLCVDTRKRLQPGLPKGYFGNAIVDVIASDHSGELVSHPLSYAASKIREAVLQVTNEYVHSAIEFMENQKDISRFQDIYALKRGEGVFYGNPNLVAVSWLTLPLHDIDFGWGKEVYMSLGTHESDGDCVIIPGKEGEDESLSVALCLQNSHIETFRKFFYADITEGGDSATILHDDIYAFSKI